MKILLTEAQAEAILAVADMIKALRSAEPVETPSPDKLRSTLRDMVLKTLSVEGADEKNRLRAQLLAVFESVGVARASEVPDSKLEEVVEKMKGVK